MSTIRARVTFKIGDIASKEAKVVKGLMVGVKAGADIVCADAKNMCPHGTGALQESIAVTGPVRGMPSVAAGGNFLSVSATIGPHMPYAEFVEYGTGIRGRGTYPGDLPTEGVPYTGSWVYDFRNQDWQGHSAQPYMRPAADNNRGSVVDAIAEAVRDALS